MAGSIRLLALIGSGELGPRMARVQRDIVRRLAAERPDGVRAVRATIVDTPYGFQANADAISDELLDFHRRRLGLEPTVAGLRRADGDVLERETALARIREADLVFSGPGSPSYAVRHWSGTPVPELLASKLTTGGAVVFASAAALAIGRLTLPVYEIYKAGEDPHWLPGLDVLSAIGISAAVLPHYDNAEGAGHDTRYCFVGERRLRVLEEQLPNDTFILGIDEHTALVIDVAEGLARVQGRGSVTVRRAGLSEAHPVGTELPLVELGRPPTDSSAVPDASSAGGAQANGEPPGGAAGDELDALVRELLSVDDPRELRARVVSLGERLQRAEDERARLVGPLIEVLLDVRQAARSGGDYRSADDIRERLSRLGIRLTDEPDGSTDFELRR